MMQRIAAAAVSIALLASACGESRPSTDEYLEHIASRVQQQAISLADEIDSYPNNIGWDYLDSAGSRSTGVATVLALACGALYETQDMDDAMSVLNRDLARTIRYQNDVLAIVFIATFAFDNICYDYDTYGT